MKGGEWSHLTYRGERTLVTACQRKVRYESEHIARLKGQFLLRLPHADKERLWPYACAHCRQWHLSSRENRKVAAITATSVWEGI